MYRDPTEPLQEIREFFHCYSVFSGRRTELPHSTGRGCKVDKIWLANLKDRILRKQMIVSIYWNASIQANVCRYLSLFLAFIISYQICGDQLMFLTVMTPVLVYWCLPLEEVICRPWRH